LRLRQFGNSAKPAVVAPEPVYPRESWPPLRLTPYMRAVNARNAAATATRTTSSMLSVTAQQPEPSVQSAIAKPSVFSTCLGTVRPKKAAPKTARIRSAMIFFMSPPLPLNKAISSINLQASD
jgi:hypothetical protein